MLSSLAPSGKVRGFHIVCEGIKDTKGAVNLRPNINQLLWARPGGREGFGIGMGEKGGGGRDGRWREWTFPYKNPRVLRVRFLGGF